MRKGFCDVCKQELSRNYVSERYSPKKGLIKCEVMVSFNGTWNSGEICLDCLKLVLFNGEKS
jgi:hypothetical protein